MPQGYCLEEEDFICPYDEAKMTFIPSGTFMMGCDDFFNARPAHEVFLDSYLMDRFLVTNHQFLKFVEEDGYKNEYFWSEVGWQTLKEQEWNKPRYWGCSPWDHPDHPVVGISWFEAEAYCKWAQKSLPTEAQWEKAARGGFWLDGDDSKQSENPFPYRKYSWGNHEADQNGEYFAIYADELRYGNQSTAPVGIVPKGKSPYRCYDLTGNVWEWCQDWYQRNYYKSSPSSNPPGPVQGEMKILKGGSWCRKGRELHISFRTKDNPQSGGWDLSGFRCVLNLSHTNT